MEYTYEQLLAIAEAVAAKAQADDAPRRGIRLIDWKLFWMQDRPATDWLAAPVVPRGCSVALFAKGGTGKSLFVLWLVAAMATGRAIFGARRPPANVLYLDYEMTEEDLLGRLESMGYGPDDDLSHLHYAVLPEVAPLDGEEGGEVVAMMADLVAADVVIIDTFGRAVHGDENEANTVRAWYRWTGQRLKVDGRAFIRIDHAGKDLERGQRGTSAKNDDVDVVWQMVELDAGRFRLTAVKRRLESIPHTVELDKVVDPDDGLTYRLVSGGIGYPAGTATVVDDLDRLGVTLDATRRDASKSLHDAGRGARTQVVSAALRFRRERVVKVVPEASEPPSREPDIGTVGTSVTEPDGTAGQDTDRGSRNHGEPGSQSNGGVGGLPVREPPPPGPTPPPDPGVF